MPLDDDVYPDSDWGNRPSARTIGADRRLARYVELAAVKLSRNSATFVFEPDLREHAALIIFNGVLEQSVAGVLVSRSTHARRSGEAGSR